MKRVVVIGEDEYKEIVSALRRLRRAVNALEVSFLAGELDAQLERIENVFSMEDLK